MAYPFDFVLVVDNTQLVRCRLCDARFATIQWARIHVETHFALGAEATRRLNTQNHVHSQIKPILNTHQPYFNLQTIREMTQLPLAQSSLEATTLIGSTIGEMAHQPIPPIHQEVTTKMEVSGDDEARPYINLLDRPLNNNDFVNAVDDIPAADPDLQEIDLALRL
ncbi:hypothetical protein RIF29_21585 [Crotalaria pallida]|uniref:C2H2-type domain-containing protein n=1 Tax=Crotalaria pallida TaxID=3830 RepID=A0AAN9F6X7_CROPI